MDHLIAPHGGQLRELLADAERAEELREASIELPSLTLTERQLCDLELLLNGGFSPLTGFLGEADYEAVRDRLRLADGTVWPMPITLDVSRETAEPLAPGRSVALRDREGFMLAILHLEELFVPDKEREAQAVFGSTSGASWRGSSSRCITISPSSAARRPSSGRSSCAWAGAAWWRSRRATPCTGPTRS